MFHRIGTRQEIQLDLCPETHHFLFSSMLKDLICDNVAFCYFTYVLTAFSIETSAFQVQFLFIMCIDFLKTVICNVRVDKTQDNEGVILPQKLLYARLFKPKGLRFF